MSLDPSVGGAFRPAEPYDVTGLWRFGGGLEAGDLRVGVDGRVSVAGSSLGAATEVLDIRAFGASTLNSGADNFTAIQAALDAVDDERTRVYIPPGRYAVTVSGLTGYLKFKSNTEVFGDGAASVIEVASNVGDYRTVFGSGPLLSTAVSNVTFRDFTIDQRPASNPSSDIRAGVAVSSAFAIAALVITEALVQRMRFVDCCGVNTVHFNSTAVRDVAVKDCFFEFKQGASSTPDYDNSAIYLKGQGLTVEGNTFRAELVERARGCCEVHGGRAVVANNLSLGYDTLVNVVAEATTPDTGDMGCSVVGNTVVDAGHAITLWSITGRVMGNVTVAGNSIALANAQRAAESAWTVALYNDSSGALDGAYSDITITGNTLVMEADERAGYTYAAEAGLYLVARGAIRHLLVAHNQIRNSPTQGVRLESVTSVAQNCHIKGNTFVDCGNNSLATAGYRTVILTAGVVNLGSTIEDNIIIDTGTTLNGYGGIINTGAAGSEVYVRRNHFKIAAASGNYVNQFSSLAYAEVLAVFTISGNFSMIPNRFERYEFRLDGSSPNFTLSHSQAYAFGQRLIVTIVNNSGGAGPTITWTAFKMAAWSNPANGFRRSIEFEFNGTNFSELWRSADVPN